MQYRKSSLVASLVLIVLSTSSAYAQNQGTSSIQFLKIIPSAKTMAMGQAGVAIQDRAESVFINPAGLAKVHKFDISFSKVDWFLDTQVNAIAAAFSFGNLGTLGLHITSVDYGTFEETRVDELGFVGDKYNPGLTGRSFSAGATLIGVSYARALTDRFSFGLTANHIREDLFLEKMETTTFNFGMMYDSKVKSLKLGIVLKNLGRKVVYVKEKNTIPQSMIVGFSGYLMSNGQNLFLYSENHQVNFVFDILLPRDDSQKYHVGVDYCFYEMFDFRAGYKLNYDTEGIAFGFGFNYKYVTIDYSYNDFGDYLEAVHRFTIGVSL